MDWNYRIKKPESGTPLNWEIHFPPGLSTWVGETTLSLLNEIPLPNQPEFRLRTFTEKIKLENANAHQITYLLMFGRFIRDVRLVVAKTSDWDQAASKRESEWDRVRTLAVPFLKPLFKKEDTLFYSIKDHLHISFFESELTVTYSLFGEPSYKRGIKGIFPTSAPVPEDLSSSLISMTYEIFGKSIQNTKLVYIPFAGTLTFATEWWLYWKNIDLLSFPRSINLKKLSMFPEKTSIHFRKKSKPLDLKAPECLVLDTDPALSPYWKNEITQWQTILPEMRDWKFFTEDFFHFDLLNFAKAQNSPLEKTSNSMETEKNNIDSHIFIAINPPYGFRKSELEETNLYTQIGSTLENLSKKSDIPFLGFLLCPSEEKWREAMTALKSFHKKTIHVTHGGIDLRVLFFESRE